MTAVFFCDYLRTPIGRFGGGLAPIRADDLAALPLSGLMARHPGLDWAAVDDVWIGCANQAGEDNRNVARMALLLAGLPQGVPGTTVNRLCGSGLDAVASAARAIASGEADLALAGGAESMSRAPFVLPKSESAFSRALEIHDTTIGWRFINPKMRALYGTDSMPETAENLAEKFGISRMDQDAFALRSQHRAATAEQQGIFAEEIIAVSVPAGKAKIGLVEADEHPRPNTSAASLAALPAPFRAGGTVTAGNASGINDGAAALILASEAGAIRHGLTPVARYLGAATIGVAPSIMGIGPVGSTQKLCRRLGLTISDFDVIELNEAFAAQALAVLRLLGLPDDAAHVNPNGGAIALGHPLGMSGARLVGTAMRQLARQGGKRALVTMCIGVGQGISLAMEAL